MDYLGLDDFSADMSSSGFAGAGGTRIEFATTTGRFERKKIWMLASEFRGEVPKQLGWNLAREFGIKWLLRGCDCWQEIPGAPIGCSCFSGASAQ